VESAGSGLPLPRLRRLFGVAFRLDFRVRNDNKSPHESCELAKVACGILCGTLRAIRHFGVPFGACILSVPEGMPECNVSHIGLRPLTFSEAELKEYSACSVSIWTTAQIIGRKTVFSVAGLVVKAGEAFGVKHHWSARLEREGLDYFRAYDCMDLKGEFRRKLVDGYGWTRPAGR
jgi:hypothetical protein